MTVQKFAIHGYEFDRVAAAHPGAFLVENVTDGGLVEGTYLSVKPLTLAVEHAVAEMAREAA